MALLSFIRGRNQQGLTSMEAVHFNSGRIEDRDDQPNPGASRIFTQDLHRIYDAISVEGKKPVQHIDVNKCIYHHAKLGEPKTTEYHVNSKLLKGKFNIASVNFEGSDWWYDECTPREHKPRTGPDVYDLGENGVRHVEGVPIWAFGYFPALSGLHNVVEAAMETAREEYGDIGVAGMFITGQDDMSPIAEVVSYSPFVSQNFLQKMTELNEMVGSKGTMAYNREKLVALKNQEEKVRQQLNDTNKEIQGIKNKMDYIIKARTPANFMEMTFSDGTKSHQVLRIITPTNEDFVIVPNAKSLGEAIIPTEKYIEQQRSKEPFGAELQGVEELNTNAGRAKAALSFNRTLRTLYKKRDALNEKIEALQKNIQNTTNKIGKFKAICANINSEIESEMKKFCELCKKAESRAIQEQGDIMPHHNWAQDTIQEAQDRWRMETLENAHNEVAQDLKLSGTNTRDTQEEVL